MDSVFKILCPRYSGPLTPTNTMATGPRETFIFLMSEVLYEILNLLRFKTLKKVKVKILHGVVDVGAVGLETHCILGTA